MASDSNLGRLTAVFRRHRAMILGAALLGAVPVALAVWLIPPRYTAKAEVLVNATGPFSAARDPASQQRLDAAAILTEVTELKSGELLRQVVQKLRADPLFRPASAPAHPDPAAAAGRAKESGIGAILGDAGAFLGGVRAAVIARQNQLTFHSFDHNLRVFQEAGSHVVAVTFISTSPKRAALAVNTLVQTHLLQEQQQAERATASGLAWLNEQIPAAKKAVQSLQDQARRYGDAKGLPTLGDQELIRLEIAQLSHELVTAQAALAEKTDRLKQMRNGKASAPVASTEIPGLSELRAREAAILDSRAVAQFSMSAANPRLQRIDSQLRAVRREIAARTAGADHAFAQEVSAESAKVALLRKRLQNLRGEVSEPKLKDLEQSIAFQSGLVNDLLKRREALREQGASYTAGVRMLSLAVPPDRPSSVSPILFLPPALVLSCLAATVLGLVRDTGDSTLRSERALYERVGIPCIAMVPKLRRRGRRSLQELLIDRPYCAYAEAIRFAAAGLGVAEARGPATVILITSAVPGEGKTTLAVSLAAVAATMGKRVLLMDLDLRHPSVQREVAPGASPRGPDEAVRSPAEVGVQPVPDLHFDLVASRRGTTNALRLFAGDDMASRIARLRRQYDCVIIDSAPLLAMAEVRLIARLADRVVVAVKWADTRADMVQNAVDLLHAPGQPPGQPPRNVFSVITQVDLKKHARQCAGDHAEIAMRYRSYYQALAG